MDSVDCWLSGSFDHPDYHDGYSEIRLRRVEEPFTIPSLEREERAREPDSCPHCGCALVA